MVSFILYFKKLDGWKKKYFPSNVINIINAIVWIYGRILITMCLKNGSMAFRIVVEHNLENHISYLTIMRTESRERATQKYRIFNNSGN